MLWMPFSCSDVCGGGGALYWRACRRGPSVHRIYWTLCGLLTTGQLSRGWNDCRLDLMDGHTPPPPPLSSSFSPHSHASLPHTVFTPQKPTAPAAAHLVRSASPTRVKIDVINFAAAVVCSVGQGSVACWCRRPNGTPYSHPPTC